MVLQTSLLTEVNRKYQLTLSLSYINLIYRVTITWLTFSALFDRNNFIYTSIMKSKRLKNDYSIIFRKLENH